MKGLILLFLCALAHAQIIYSVSSFQSCFDISITGSALNCTDSGGLATVLDIGLSAADNQSATTDFVVKLSTLPPDSNSLQLQTSDTCQIPTSDGQCQTASYTEIRFQVSNPVLEYSLIPTNGRTRNPFTVPYAYLVYFCPQNSVTGIQSDATCSLLNVQSIIYSSPDVPDDVTIQSTFLNQTMNEQFIRCKNVEGMPPPTSVYTTSTSMMSYTFTCNNLPGGTVGSFSPRYILEFYSLAPMCQVWEVQNPPSIFTSITINATGQGQEQVWTLESVGPGSSKASPLGNIIARIEAVQSPSGNFGQDIPGLIITCTDNDTLSFNMSVPGTAPQINPWTYLESIDPTFNATFLLPTPVNIKRLTGVDQVYAMFMHVDSETSRGYSENCGGRGVAENIYDDPPQQLYFSNYAARYASTSQTEIPYKDIASFENILTCVPDFGFPYLGINTTSPCNALSIFLELQKYMIDNDIVVYQIPNLPRIYNPGKPNMWIVGNILYYQPSPKDITYETVLSFAGSIVAIGAKVANAQINTAQSSCYVSTADGACGSTATSVNATNCAMYITVCNTSPPGVYGFFSLQAVCASDSNLAPSSLFQPEIANLPGGNCTLATIPLVITGTELGSNPSCTVTVFSNSFSITPQSVINDRETFLCGVNNATNTNLPVPPLVNISSIPVLYPNPTVFPSPAPSDDDIFLIVFCIIAALSLLSFILLFIVFCCLKVLTK